MASGTIFFDSTNRARNIPNASGSLKRGAETDCEDEASGKRMKSGKTATEEVCDTDNKDDKMVKREESRIPHRPQRRDLFSSLTALRTGNPVARRTFNFPTIRILETFVSSHKADLYKCHSLSAAAFLTLPYACAFSNGSKRGESSTLAVATEHGTVDIIKTTKRREWGQEGARSTLEIHDNGIFDVKWSPDDRVLATASGDNTVRIVDPRAWRGEPLHVLSDHSSTVKCLAWDPSHNDLLASAGRDGCVCLWDLRESRRQEDSMDVDDDKLKPTAKIVYAHEPVAGKATKRGRTVLAARGVTSLVYSPASPHELITSGSGDGILRKWDIRCLPTSPRKRTKKSTGMLPIDEAVDDLTKTQHSSFDVALTSSPRRSRGITSLALGCGPTAGKIFALANDSRVHTYNPRGAADLPLSVQQTNDLLYSHRHMSTNSFYVKIGTSPCGRWLASGSSHGSAFLFDVGSGEGRGVELRGQEGEVGALDWADGALATCADDGTVRVWRPDLDRYRECVDNAEEEQHAWSWAKV
ncbi:WD40 repeat-like protein [Schizopora paradoxa]|uniref:WD40 repeat-like protein n=1 Tax=Schizopora paradoxa TaxID=27342 RepID=A0A0H2RTR4_9AGAM|nr:WD40 repeat-like protein [Schizopora paradoxa]